MSDWTLVTGASSGIGLELARSCARRKHNLILTARRKDNLEVLAQELRRGVGIEVRVFAADLARPGSAEALWREIEKTELPVEHLVNNAGFGRGGSFASLPPGVQAEMIQLNAVSLMELTRLCLPAMLARRSGRILNVASTAAFQPGPYMAVYYATKAFVLSFSEALAEELRNTGVTVTALCPGLTRTEFQAWAGVRETRLTRMFTAEAADVAEAGYAAMMAGRRVVIPEIKNRIGALAARLAPRGLVLRVVGAMQKSRR